MPTPASPAGAGAAARPNIVLILADDMGYSDIGCFGAEIATPHLDALAAGGARLTQMYNCARCCPSRAALLTGRHPHQAGVGHMVGDAGRPGYRGFLNDASATIGEALRPAGYRTYMAGKWHVGGTYDLQRPETWRPGAPGHPLPIQRGFDRHWGTLAGAGSYFSPPTLIDGDRFVEPEAEDFYYTDAIGRHAGAMAAEGLAAGAPFFLYAAFTAPHWPLHATPEDIARYEGLYRGGWEWLRTARHERAKSLGLLSERWGISARDDRAPAWADLPSERREWEACRMAVYAAQITALDRAIGRLLQPVADAGALEDTLVVFVSDNGGCAEFLSEDGTDRYRRRTRDGRPVRVGNVPALAPGAADTFMSYDLPWANASNAPFRLYKHWVHEGGISSPCVVSWPAAIPAGSIIHEPAHFIDMLPTFLQAAAHPAPEGVEGEGLLPLLRGERWERTRPLFWEHEGNRAVRAGAWKLVSRHPGPWELYNMEEDRTEGRDLAAGDARRAGSLAAEYQEWAARCGVVPWAELHPRREAGTWRP